MKRVIVACEILKSELEKALEVTGACLPVIWIDSHYHMNPDTLRTKLQEIVDSLQDVQTILFTFGCCGMGLVGLEASTGDFVIPKVDDCISMLLQGLGKKCPPIRNTYFLTQGWMDSSQGLVEEYNRTVERYGIKKTERIFGLMLKHYKYLMLIDTGAYDLEKWKYKAEDLSKKIQLELVIQKGSTRLLERLLIGPHDDDFFLVPQGHKVTLGHFGPGKTQGAPAFVNIF